MQLSIRGIVRIVLTMGVVGSTPAGAAEPSFEFLRQDVGARPAALGGAFGAVLGDPHSVFYNPAGLGAIGTPRGMITYTDHLLDFQVLTGSIAYPLADIGTVAFGLHYLNYGDFEGRDAFGNATGDFTANDFAVTGSFARTIVPHLHGGVSIKYIRSSIGRFSSDAYAFDLGAVYRFEGPQMNLAVSIANMGRQRSAFIDTREGVPGHVKVGLAKALADAPLTLLGEFRQFNNGDTQFMGGVEASVQQMVQIRVGYNSIGKDQKFGISRDNLAGFSFGGGVQYRKWMFDYALTISGGVGYLNTFSLSSFL